MLSLSNTSRARSWFLAFCSSCGVMPFAAHALELGQRDVLHSIERRAVGRRHRDRVEKRLLRRHAATVDCGRQAGVRPAPDTAARSAAAAACGSSTTGSRPSRRSAPRRARAAGRSRRRSPPARGSRPSDTPSCLPSRSSPGARRAARARASDGRRPTSPGCDARRNA